MTVTIARTLVTVPIPITPAKVGLAYRFSSRRIALFGVAALAGGLIGLGGLEAEVVGQERFDLRGESPGFVETGGSWPLIPTSSGDGKGRAAADRLRGKEALAQPPNPLRQSRTPPVKETPRTGIGPLGEMQSDFGQMRNGVAGWARSNEIVIQELPPAARQVGHAESIQFGNLPTAAEWPQTAALGEDKAGFATIPEFSLRPLPASPGELQLGPRQLAFEPFSARENQVQPANSPQESPSETWWRGEVAAPFCGLPQTEPLDLGTLIQLTLRGSPYLQAISQEPLVREEDAAIARADFDPVLFARSLYDDRTEPVGNTLTTGGLPFLKDNIWTGQAGIRRKYFTGGKLEASQLLGFQNSNSRFFVPQDQGTATLAINLQQPLLRGAGQAYNRSQIVIAQVNAGASWDEVASRIQDELSRSVVAYWDLYAKRAIYLQMLRNLERSESILRRLEARSEYDVQALQLSQARAAVTSRRVQLANALRDVRNAETEIRQIVGDSQLINSDQIELLTVEPPGEIVEPLELAQSVEVALANRPEIREAMNRLKAAAVKNDVTRNEMLPDLSLLFGTYVKGLKGDSALGQAWEQQFVNSTPGYSAGLQYEFPWRNRAAISRNRQNRLEYVRFQNELEQATIGVIAETQKSFRDLNSGIETLASAQVALDAVLAELRQLEVRWDAFPLVEGDWYEGQTQSLLLDQLLAAQQKLMDREREVTVAELELKKAQIALKRAMGVVLDFYQVSTETTCPDGLPRVDYHSAGSGPQVWPSLPAEDNATAPLGEIK